MKVILNNGTELTAEVVNGNTRQFQGSIRSSLEFQFVSANVTFEQLDKLFADESNTKRITLQDAESGSLQENYSLRVSIGFAPTIIKLATDSTPELVENRFTVVMAQKTYAEMETEALKEMVALLTEVAI